MLLGSFSNDEGDVVDDSFYKKGFIYWPRVSQLCRSVQFAYWSRNLLRLNMTVFNSKGRQELAIAINVLQNKYNFVISRCCLAEDGNEMYKDLKRTCRNIVLVIKPFFYNVIVAITVVVCENALLFPCTWRHRIDGTPKCEAVLLEFICRFQFHKLVFQRYWSTERVLRG